MAAGRGERMHPVTLTTPKPLVRVNGQRMIDSVIDALHKNGIYEIYVVVGYKQEQFLTLTEEYEGLVLIHNPYYETCNNISSLYVARDHLEDVIILDGDLNIQNDAILSPEFERSGYNAVWTEEDTVEWLMQVNDEGIVTECSRDGGEKGWILFSISRWTKEDCRKLKKFLEYEFDYTGNRHLYWDDVAMFKHFEEFSLGITPMDRDDVVEIDSFDELVRVDASYKDYVSKF